MTPLTAPAISWGDFEPALVPFHAGASFDIGDLAVDSFTIPHDAADPVGFCFGAEGRKIGFVTDLGYLPDSVKYYLRDTDFLVLESNHDLEMLKVGPYPWAVKQRVMSRKGHLSNDVVSRFVLEDMAASTRTLLLGHLSENNNHPEIVRLCAAQALERRGLGTRLVVAEPRQPTGAFLF
jgi:phosphoribosyl 1,2-cyclic phosphodiesterase